LAFLWALKMRYRTDLDIFGAAPLHEWNVPEIVKKAAKYLNEEKRKRKFNKKEGISREELRKIWLDCFVSSRRES